MTSLGIIGFGGMGAYHARQLAHISDVQVRVIVDPLEANQERARQFYSGNVRVAREIDNVIDETVDGWIVASSTATHIPITRLLLEQGSRVLLEKPIANESSAAAIISHLVREDSSNLMMGHTLLWHRQFQKLRDLLKDKHAIKAIHATRPRSEDHRVRYPGETPFSLTMVHDLYTLFALVEGAEPIEFTAQQREHRDGGVDVAHAQLLWADGLFASLRADYLIPDSVAAQVINDELEISGADWSIVLPYDRGILHTRSEAGLSDIDCPLPERAGVSDYYEDAIRSELEHFIALINDKASVPIGARYHDACRIQGWIDRFIALAQGKV